jgi:hypothetical protein
MDPIVSLLRQVEQSTLTVGEAISALRILVAVQVESRLLSKHHPVDILHDLFAATSYRIVYEEFDANRFLWCVETSKGLIPVYE